MGPVKQFIQRHYRHFNSAVIADAAQGWADHLEAGGKMMLTMGGAMSTAELGISVAELIRRDKVHAITVTGANLEEDFCNLVAHDSYERVPNYRDFTPQDEIDLLKRGLNRVTDTCIPEEEAFRRIDKKMIDVWKKAEDEGRRHFPHEYFYEVIRSGVLEDSYEIDPNDSWLVAASKKNLPIWTPGWEDSSFGNSFVAEIMKKTIRGYSCMKSGLEAMEELVGWYKATVAESSVGFFQIGGGISGDYPICAVPLITQDLRQEIQRWGYFCQISEAATSYGSYSGAVPNEKITWGKLDISTPKFVIESDATIVFPLIVAHLLDW